MMHRRVAIIGVGATKMGELWDRSLRDLGSEAGLKAVRDAKVEGDMITALYMGTMSAGKFAGQEHVAALTADFSGLLPIEATRTEAACASGSVAFRSATMAIASGMHECVVAGGAEKMTDLSNEQVTSTLIGAGDEETEGFAGLTFPGVFALIAKRYMHDYPLTRDDLSLIPVKNHAFGVNNPNAQYQREISLEIANHAQIIADPLRLFDCAPISDGAATVVLASEEFVKEHDLDPIWIKASAQASDTLALHDRRSLTELAAVREAAKIAYRQSGLTPNDIDVAELHDCFSIAEVLAYEALGFCERGKAHEFLRNRAPFLDGQIPVNTDGGLKVGHPVGSTGIKQLVEIVNQLKNRAYNQVKDARYGLTQNIGGSGATAVVHILERE